MTQGGAFLNAKSFWAAIYFNDYREAYKIAVLSFVELYQTAATTERLITDGVVEILGFFGNVRKHIAWLRAITLSIFTHRRAKCLDLRESFRFEEMTLSRSFPLSHPRTYFLCT